VRSRPVWTVFVKEVLENLRDRRALFTALMFGPLFGPILFAVMTSIMLDRAISDSDKPVPIVVVGEAIAPNLVSFLRENGAQLTFAELSLEQARASVSRGRHDLILIVPKDYPQRLASGQAAAVDLVWDSSQTQVGARARRASALVAAYGRRLAAQRLLVRGVDPSTVTPISVRDVDVATPASRAILVLGMTTYFVLFSTLMGGLYLAIDTTAGERERGSLEPLFTLPVARSRLVIGKVLATCAFMTVSLILTLTAFAVSLKFVPLEALGMTANFSPSVAFTMLAVMLPFVPFGAGLMTVVGALTKSYREAQTWLGFVLLVPTLPIVFATMNSLRTSLAIMPVPSLSQHLLATNLLRGESVGGLELAISAASTLALAAILIAVAVRLYARESVLG
jgi:sodium transport system permease protein